MCEIRLTKLSCAAQQVGIVHFYAVTEIKVLSCRLWRMREWRNLLISTHVGYRSVIRAVASGASLKFGLQGASATNWFSRVNGARDNGIRLYIYSTVFMANWPEAEWQDTIIWYCVLDQEIGNSIFNYKRQRNQHINHQSLHFHYQYWLLLLISNASTKGFGCCTFCNATSNTSDINSYYRQILKKYESDLF